MKRIPFLIIATLILAPLFSEVYKSGVTASYYAEDFHGKRTSNGERFNMNDYTCAHKALPFDTILKVTNLSNGKTCNVRVNDRGPFVASREIDLSKAAAIKLGMIGSGTAIVKRGPETKLSQQTAASASKIMAKLGGGSSSGASNSGSAGGTKSSKNSAKSKSTASTAKKSANLTPGTYWDIQLGAFSTKENAKEFAHRLSRAGFHDIVLQTSDSQGITRVAIKKVPASKVTDTQNQLAAAGFKDQTLRQRKD